MKLFAIRWRDDATGRFIPAAIARKLSRALVSKVRLRMGRDEREP